MAEMMVMTLREGVETFLIVAIAAAYLRKTERAALLPAVGWGVAAAIVLSVLLGSFLADVAVSPLYEGLLALVAAALVISMVVYMLYALKYLRAEMDRRLEAAAARPGVGAWLGVFAFTLFMITREGMEMAVITASISRNQDSASLVTGALLGIAFAATLACAWLRWGYRVDLTLFFQATAIFLIMFSVQLLYHAFQELAEANAIPGLDNAWWHVATAEWAEGIYGQIYTTLMVLLPLAWLGWRRLARQT